MVPIPPHWQGLGLGAEAMPNGNGANAAANNGSARWSRPNNNEGAAANDAPPHPEGKQAKESPKKGMVFGFECDSALHLAIKRRATEAAMVLIGAGACVNFPNAKVSNFLS